MGALTTTEFEAQLPYILDAPRDKGALKMIVIRPQEDARQILPRCHLSAAGGAEGDSWAKGCWKTLPDGSPHPDVQLTLMNYRVLEVIEAEEERRALAGDNLCVDFDLSEANLKAGDRLSLGGAILEVTAEPHNGCRKFKERYGADVLKYVNSETGKTHHLRGIYVRVVQDGTVQVGDTIAKLAQ